MAGPFDVLRGLQYDLSRSDRLSDITTWNIQEFDLIGEDARIDVPAVQMSIVSRVESNTSTSNYVEPVLNEDNNQIGYILDYYFNMRVQIDIWDAAASGRFVSEMGQRLNRELRRYDRNGRRDFLTDPDDPEGQNSDGYLDVTDIQVTNGLQNDRLTHSPYDQTSTPTLRRWTEEINVEFLDRVNTVEEYGEFGFVRNVIYPGDGDFKPGVGDQMEIHYVPPLQ